ncbi:MAG: endonuclease/exonuclease/phosphatase family protein [Planctomycetota bacterium]|nr:MAG: endonuclease/exonuclease/phosphatase family protein [Planctomycetota bacterium]
MRFSPRLLTAAALLPAAVASCAAPPAAAPPPPLRLMSFNLRSGTAADGPDRWELRREAVFTAIADFAPEVLAVQEGVDFQMAELRQRFPRLRQLGQHRRGGTRGEFSGLLVAEDRLEVVAWGEFWLSPTPDEVGSQGWDAALPRMAVWALLRDRRAPAAAPAAAPFLALGTHFDHRGALARLESARLILRRLDEIRAARAPAAPVVVLGDLNAGEDSPPLAAFRAGGLRDSFRVLHPAAGEAGTFNAFQGRTDGDKIDHILVGPGWRVAAAEILRPRRPDGRCASDHDPVLALLAPAPAD